MLKWALAGGEVPLFVCHSAEHHLAEKTFLAKSADGEKKREGGEKKEKESELGFWESLVGTRSLAHCGCVTLTFGNGEGGEKS